MDCYCLRCHKRLPPLANEYCSECFRIVVEEHERERKERERQAEEKRDLQRQKEGFRNRTLTQEEYGGLEGVLKDEYRKDPITEEEIKSFKEAIFSQPKQKVKDTYNHWAFCMYRKNIMCMFESNKIRLEDEIEKQVYDKEIRLIESCKSMDEFQLLICQLPHKHEIDKDNDNNRLVGRYGTFHSIRWLKVPGEYYFFPIETYMDTFGSCLPHIVNIDFSNCRIFLSKEECLLFRTFSMFAYNDKTLQKYDWEYLKNIYWQYNADTIKSIDSEYLNNWLVLLDITLVNRAPHHSCFYFPLSWNEFCDIQYDRYIKTVKEEAEKQTAFARFLSTPDVAETVKSDEPEADSPDTPDPGKSIPVQKVKKPKKVDACNGNTRFTASWK